MLQQNKNIGVDIGGSNIRVGIVENGTIITILEEKTPTELSNINKTIVRMVEALGEKKTTSIGIAVPGIVDNDRKRILYAPNLNQLNGVNFGDLWQGSRVANDAELALYGETISDPEIMKNNILYITLGTGIGSAVLLNGRVIHRTELGHFKVVPGGEKCQCGQHGCLEAYFSKTAIITRAKQEISHELGDVLQVFDSASSGDERAIEIIRSAATMLGFAIANVANLLEIKRVIFSGKIALSFDLFRSFVESVLRENIFAYDQRTPIALSVSSMIDKSAIIGAAIYGAGKEKRDL